MAITLKRKKRLQLGNTITNQVSSFVNQRNAIRSKEEAEFYRKVVDSGLSSGAQKEYWQERIMKEKEKNVPDNVYIRKMRTEITSLNKLIRADKFTKAYLESFEELKMQKKNINDHLRFLEDSLEGATDVELKDAIQEKITEAKISAFETRNRVIENRATYAIQNKSIPMIDKSIDDVEKERAKALAIGDEDSLLKWENKLNALNNAKATQTIQDTFNDLEINQMQKPLTAEGIMDFYIDNLNNAVGNGPVNINGTRYDSLKDFWQGELNTYMETKFFTAYQNEATSKLNKASKTLSPILEKQIKEMNIDMDRLSNIDEIKAFTDKFEQLRTTLNFDAVSALGNKVFDDYRSGRLGDTSSENYEKAINKLNNLNSLYNVDVSGQLDAITNDRSSKISSVASNIAQIAGAYEAEGLSPEEALAKATSEVPALDIPASEIVGKTPEEIARDISQSAKGEDSRFDIKKATETTKTPAKTEIEKTEPTKKATLFGPSGEKEVVDVGSSRASELQGKGFKLTQEEVKPINTKAEDQKKPEGIKETVEIKPKKATLVGPGGEKEVVDVGSGRASELQTKGYKLG
jgi:hypothetical protein